MENVNKFTKNRSNYLATKVENLQKTVEYSCQGGGCELFKL